MFTCMSVYIHTYIHTHTYTNLLHTCRELSDNFCHYNDKYDSLEGCAEWARESLQAHAADKRLHVYRYDSCVCLLYY